MKGTKRKHRLLSILLSLMLVVGLMPAMSTTVFATNTITTVKASGIKAPVAGESATDSSYKTVTLPSGQGYTLLDVVWYSDYENSIEASTFEAGKKYYAEVWLDAETGYQFASTSGINVTYEGEPPYSVEVRTGNARMFFAVELTCPVPITEVKLTCDEDAITFDTSKTEKATSLLIEQNAKFSSTPVGALKYYPTSLSYWYVGQWYGIGDGSKYISNMRKYSVSYQLGLSSGYTWPEGVASGDFSKLKITVNGKDYQPEDGNWSYNSTYGTLYIKYIPKSQQNKLVGAIAEIELPQVGKSPSSKAEAASTDYTVSSVKWYWGGVLSEPGTEMKSTDVFSADQVYIAEVAFTPVEGKSFAPDASGNGLYIRNLSSSLYIPSLSNETTVVVRGYYRCPHDYVTTTVKATTSKNGSVVTKCSGCGDVKSSETIYYPKTMKLSTTNYTYSGGVKTPTVSIIDANGKTVSSANYNVSYATGRKSVGKYKVTVTFKGDKYSGSTYTYFNINPKGTSISKVTGAKKAFTVKWKKQSSKMATSTITGYQIRYSTSSKMTSAKTKTVKGYKYTSKKITKLSAKKKYYVQVRTYKTVSGKTYYSSWSSVKSVKTK